SPERTSSRVTAKLVNPFIRHENFSAVKSSQPILRGRPVETPNSLPTERILSAKSPHSSVGNGPEPTRVVYATQTPNTLSTARAVNPVPKHAPAAVGWLLVT